MGKNSLFLDGKVQRIQEQAQKEEDAVRYIGSYLEDNWAQLSTDAEGITIEQAYALLEARIKPMTTLYRGALPAGDTQNFNNETSMNDWPSIALGLELPNISESQQESWKKGDTILSFMALTSAGYDFIEGFLVQQGEQVQEEQKRYAAGR